MEAGEAQAEGENGPLRAVGVLVLRAVWDTRWRARRIEGVSHDDNGDGGLRGVRDATVEEN